MKLSFQDSKSRFHNLHTKKLTLSIDDGEKIVLTDDDLESLLLARKWRQAAIDSLDDLKKMAPHLRELLGKVLK